MVIFPISGVSAIPWVFLELGDMFPENSIPTVLTSIFCVGESYFGQERLGERLLIVGTMKIREPRDEIGISCFPNFDFGHN